MCSSSAQVSQGFGNLPVLSYCSWFWANSIARLRLDMWKTVPTANTAVFRSGVTSVTLGIPDINERLSLSTTFNGSGITPGDLGS